MKKPYQYAFRDNAKGVYTHNDVYVERGDELEKYIYDKYALPLVQDLAEKRALVDIGSGEGRYSRYFGKDFKRVIAVEPDEHRYQKTLESLTDMSNVECVHGTAGDVQLDESVDLVVNIHVLQHIHSSEAEEILNFATDNIADGGLFVLAMTKKTDLDYPWNIAWQDDRSRYSAVPEQIFEYVTTENVKG
ncbi:MAG: class I SAM-dependent methyltransferase, partial [Actinobacteria bacterium]|nr:class I SAM-dependent methyltransferase [Actinomycetota bacterium]